MLGPTSVIGGVPIVKFSPSGTLLYATGASDILGAARALVWVERDGRATLIDSLPVAGGIDQGLGLSPDGSRLALVLLGERGSQVAVTQLPDGPVSPFEGTSGRPVWSPDGRDLFYVAERNGKNVVLRRRADGSGTESVAATDSGFIYEVVSAGRWQVSRSGGIEPVWSPDGRELYFRALDGGLVSASIAVTPSFRVTGTRVLFDASPYQTGLSHANYAVTPDNRRFVFVPYATNPGHFGRLVMVRNLFTELGPRLEGR